MQLQPRYYSNEQFGILSSMNLNDFSQNHNLEAGVLSKGVKFDKEAFEYFNKIFGNCKLLLKREPIYKDGCLKMRKSFERSVSSVDIISEDFDKLNFEKETKDKNPEIVRSQKSEKISSGYCIRTGSPIPFNIESRFH